MALAQKDWKRLVAYSSVSHMAMVMLGMFALNPVGLTGSIIQQLNHGISTGGLFLLVGVVYERRHTREISEYGGLSKVMPVYAAIFLVMTMSSIGLPTLNGFIGELLILQGVFVANKMWAAFAGSGVVLGAAYMLYLYQRTMFGKIENPKNERLLDMSHREFATFAPLLVLAVWMGIYPAPFLRRLETSVQQIILRVSPQYAAEVRRVQHRAADRRSDRRVNNPAAKFLSSMPCDTTATRCPSTTTGRAGKALMPPGVSLSDFYYILPELVLTGGRAARADRRRAAAEGAPRGAGLGHAARARRHGAALCRSRTPTSRSRTACSRSISSRCSSRSSSSARRRSPC